MGLEGVTGLYMTGSVQRGQADRTVCAPMRFTHCKLHVLLEAVKNLFSFAPTYVSGLCPQIV